MTKNYSRLASVEERKNKKDAARFIVLAVIALILLIVVGIPLFARFSTFIGDLKSDGNQNSINDITPPAPPSVSLPPEHTNQNKVTIEGTSESNITIKISANSDDSDIKTDTEGKFTYEFNLKEGENTFSAAAVDAAGNESHETKNYKIVFDKTNPEIKIESHTDHQSIYGEKNRSIKLTGTTEVGANVMINDKFVSLDSDGKFSFSNNLGDGENKFNIKVTDLAGNFTEMDFFVNFSPY